jgi:hypothetical protein
MKHDDVVAALKVIAEKGMAINLSKDDLQSLKAYKLIDVTKAEENERSPACTLTLKGIDSIFRLPGPTGIKLTP